MVSKENTIYIGKKPFMNYVTAIMMQFKNEETKEILVRARGKTITKAVDIVLVAIERFLENKVKVEDIKIESEIIKDENDKETRVSCIDILLKKE